MAAAHTFLSPQQFEELYTGDIKPHYEYWFGEAAQKPMPTIAHGVMQAVLVMLLMNHGWFTATEVRLKLSKVAFPVPDLIAHRSSIAGPYPTAPFDLCVEILSPGDKLTDVFRKAAHYLDWGVAVVWIIDPAQTTCYQMSLDNPKPVTIESVGALTAGSGSHTVSITTDTIFSEAARRS